MRFRPCIDLRKGKVTQIVGSTLTDNDGDSKAVTNFESQKSSGYFASLYQKDGLKGGHVIMLGPGNEEAALEALRTYPKGLQVGGGINPSNALKYLDAGASHVIVTSYVFKNGEIKLNRLKEMVKVVGRERLVLDLSCRKKIDEGKASFYVVTDRWQKFTNYKITKENLEFLSSFCTEFLVHGVDVEGKRQGVDADLVKLLGQISALPVTYAGGVRSVDDLKLVQTLGAGKVDVTVGSALDIFGGDLSYEEVAREYGTFKTARPALCFCSLV
ncbi:hypothetical protein AAMO2058_000049900 [Amorphochlora amoebiformis]